MSLSLNVPKGVHAAVMALAVVLGFASTSSAQLLNFETTTHPNGNTIDPVLHPTAFGYPFIELTTAARVPGGLNVGSTSFDVGADGNYYLTITTYPQWITLRSHPMASTSEQVFQAYRDTTGDLGTFRIKVRLDPLTGQMIGNPATDSEVLLQGSFFIRLWLCAATGSDDLNTCPTGPYDFAPIARGSGRLLTGRVVDFGSEINAATGTGRFQFRVANLGGELLNPDGVDSTLTPYCDVAGLFDVNGPGCFVTDINDLLQASTLDMGVDINSANLFGSFKSGLMTGTAYGTAGPIAKAMGLACYGVVSGRVWNDLNHNGIQDGEPGLDGAVVKLRHVSSGFTASSGTTDSTGTYWVRACPGDSQIEVSGPQWYAASPANQGGNPSLDSTASGAIVNLPDNIAVSSVDFGFYNIPPLSSAYTTFTDSAWGAKPKTGNAAKTLADYFSLLYPLGEAIIGIPDTPGRYSVTVTGAESVQVFLPQGGKPGPLTASYVDPAHIVAGKLKGHLNISQLLGNVMALKFNVEFSKFAVTRVGLANLKVKSGIYATKTVGEILDMANKALAGDPLYTAYKDLSEVIDAINKNFNAGTTDKGFLIIQ